MQTKFADQHGVPGPIDPLDPFAMLNPRERERRVLDAARAIVGRLETLAQEQMGARIDIETRWIDDLKLYYGQYDATFAKKTRDEQRSTAFVKLTKNKTNGWEARLSDLLFPTDDRNWGIRPTPVPMLAAAAKEAAALAQKKVQEANRAKDQGDPAAAAGAAADAQGAADIARQSDGEIAEANKRCGRMQDAIEDQLMESHYAAQCRDAIRDGCRIGTGIIKGPLTANRLRSEWTAGEAGFTLDQAPDPSPEFVRVDPWHFFPDMSARRIEQAEFTFERSLPTKKDLRRYARKFGFDKAAVARLLEEGPPEVSDAMSNLRQLHAIADEADPTKNRWVMWEYHGPLECDEIVGLLRALGDDASAEAYRAGKDPLEEHRVIIHFIGGEVLKIAAEYPLDSGDGLYSVWNFEASETAIFGYGVPNAGNDSQRMINAAWRMMSDNSALSVAPQIVIDKAAVRPVDSEYSLRPLKMWEKTGDAIDGNPPFQVFNIPNNQQALAGIIELGKAFMDEETALPLIAQGEQGAAARTVGGMSMLFNSANVVFRRVVKSWDDDITTPTIRRAYDWNMQFHPDEGVKGDMQVDARGTSVLLVREVQSQNLLNIVTNWTVHPVLGAYIKVYPALEKTLQTMMIQPKDILFSQEEAEKRQAQASAPPEQAPPPEPPPAQEDHSLEIAKLDAETRRYVADMGKELKTMEIAERSGAMAEGSRARLEAKRIEAMSRERMKAADIGVEQQRADEARIRGEPPQDAVGRGIG